MSDAWHVRFSPSGRLAYGSQVLSVDGVAYAPGTSPRWLSDDALVYTRQPDGALVAWPSGEVLRAAGFNDLDACEGRWAGWRAADDAVVTSWALQLPGCRMPRLSRTGLAYAQPVGGDAWRIVVAGRVLVEGRVRDLRLAPSGAAAWSQHVDGRWETWGAQPGRDAERLHVSRGDEFWPVPVDTPDGPWVLSHTHTALWLRPWGDDQGVVVHVGVTDFPDAIWLGDRWHVAWSAAGVLAGRDVPWGAPRVPLEDGPAPPPPPPAPEPLPTEPPTGGLMLETLNRLRAQYGATMSDDECVALINAAAWEHRAEGYGLSRKDFGTRGRRYDGLEACHDVLMLQDGRYWDCLSAAGGASVPTWSANPSGTITDPRRGWVAAIVPQGAVEPPVPPQPPQPPATDLEARVAALERWRVELASYVVRTATGWPR